MNEIIKELLKKGYLIEPNLTELLNEYFSKIPLTKILIQLNAPKLLSKQFFLNNINRIIGLLPGDLNKNSLAKISNLLTREQEIKQEKTKKTETTQEQESTPILNSIKQPSDFISRKARNVIISEPVFDEKKIEVKDFINFFKNRFLALKAFVQKPSLEGLTSISKIPISRTNRPISVIGLVYSMRLTKNKNLLIVLEDMTGRIPIVINKNREELIEKAQSITLDEVIGVRAIGSKEILFANDVVFPDIAVQNTKKSPNENYAAFTADIHLGSDKFLEKNLLKFIKWLNGEIGSEAQKELSKKVRYLFIVGDTIDGVGVYPGQEKEIVIHSVYEQYSKLAKILNQLRKDITIIICPGGKHDAVRSLEPQPIIPKEVAPELHEMENIVMVTNPSRVRIEKTDNFEGLEVLMYHGDSYFYYCDSVEFLRKSNVHLHPDKVTLFLLKKRHLAPSHSSTAVIPYEKDALLIKKVPDIVATGHMHRSSISRYNGIHIISCSCWQEKTSYSEKFGHEPDPCKVPLLNLKTGKVTMLDFS